MKKYNVGEFVYFRSAVDGSVISGSYRGMIGGDYVLVVRGVQWIVPFYDVVNNNK